MATKDDESTPRRPMTKCELLRVGTMDRYEVCDVPLVIDGDAQLVTDDGHKSIDKIYEVISKHA